MQCPECGSENLYDNRRENDERIARGEKPRPDWKCKDCNHVEWRPKGQAAKKPAAQQKQGYTTGGRLPGEEPEPATQQGGDRVTGLFALYDRCMDHVVTSCVPYLMAADIGASPESISSMTSTLFIQAVKGGA